MSTNPTVNYVYQMSLYNNSKLGNNLRNILNSVGSNINKVKKHTRQELCQLIDSKWRESCNEEDIRKASQIRELIDHCNNINHNFVLDRQEAKEIIKYLCTE